MRSEERLDEALFLEVLVRLAVIDVALFVFELFHSLLFEYLVPTFPLEFLCHWRVEGVR